MSETTPEARSYAEIMHKVLRNLERHGISQEMRGYYRSICTHEDLEQCTKQDGSVVIVCTLCGMNSFL